MNEKTEIREIDYGSEEYSASLDLRDLTLRQPLGLSLYAEDLSGEEKDCHIGAFAKGQLAGIVIMRGLNEEEVKMRQLGVSEEMRGQGIAKALIVYAEKYARDKGYRRIVLNARAYVVELYEKLGYIKTGREFTEVNIPHYRMYKILW